MQNNTPNSNLLSRCTTWLPQLAIALIVISIALVFASMALRGDPHATKTPEEANDHNNSSN